jgi:uncharacterized protein YcfJ
VNTRLRLSLAAVVSLMLVACAQEPGFFEVTPSQTAEDSIESAPDLRSAEPSSPNKAPNRYDGYAIPKPITCDKQNDGAVAGAVIGGALGGFLGNQIPEKKEDKATGTALGVMLGALLGSMIGASANDDEGVKCQSMDGILEDTPQIIQDGETLDA